MNGGSKAASAGNRRRLRLGPKELPQPGHLRFGAERSRAGFDADGIRPVRARFWFRLRKRKSKRAAGTWRSWRSKSRTLRPRLDKKYQSNAGQYGGQVGGLFQEMLGRTATQEENDHFGKMLASGEVDPYDASAVHAAVARIPPAAGRGGATKQTATAAPPRQQLASNSGSTKTQLLWKGQRERHLSLRPKRHDEFTLFGLRVDQPDGRHPETAFGLHGRPGPPGLPSAEGNGPRRHLQNRDLAPRRITPTPRTGATDSRNYNAPAVRLAAGFVAEPRLPDRRLHDAAKRPDGHAQPATAAAAERGPGQHGRRLLAPESALSWAGHGGAAAGYNIGSGRRRRCSITRTN
jgi:hypothetical protein